MDKLRVAILIVSDTASANPASDKVFDALTPIFAAEGKWEPPHPGSSRITWARSNSASASGLMAPIGITSFCSAEEQDLQSKITPRRHGMIAASLKVTPFAMMARPVAGVRDKSLIITLPGSPKGAMENLDAVVKLLPHACMQAAGANSRNLHAGGMAKLESEAGVSAQKDKHQHQHNHHHHHHHGHDHGHGHKVPKAHTSPSERPQSNDPNAGPNRRYRSSPYPMLSVDEALRRINEQTPDPEVVEVPVTTSLIGSVIAEDVYAAEAVPAYRASIVDGYAIIAPDSSTTGPSTKGVFPVASITHANVGGNLEPLQQGTIARITTGAPSPRTQML
ncbi:uncharacterized protein N7446_001484 [Penicillium canescens]|uniref:uncharacterized protein n=1 Tax=Penicillium canescens TaxID=5083 RepID=UPI0026DFDC79|nr:uncharacterized protein N7446_001484 [Penicillium canescens]KAJ6073707.1 hypothetical protein N7446_001484 [Penicillium canescens]